MDDQTFEVNDQYSLDRAETCCSLCTVAFADDGNDYFAVGTAYVIADESEPSKVSSRKKKKKKPERLTKARLFLLLVVGVLQSGS